MQTESNPQYRKTVKAHVPHGGIALHRGNADGNLSADRTAMQRYVPMNMPPRAADTRKCGKAGSCPTLRAAYRKQA